jgi:DNA-binding LacI/PurR family transcriptional regulator
MKARGRFNSQDVAKAAGVSRTTVSYVLNNRHVEGRIAEHTRQNVLRVAAEMGYRMNPLSRGLKFDKTKLIGVFCQVRADDFHNRILNAIHQASHAAGYLVLNAYVQGMRNSANRWRDFHERGGSIVRDRDERTPTDHRYR